MARIPLFLTSIAAAAACSAAPSSGGGDPTGNGVSYPGPLPENAPFDPNLKNVPATNGRANLTPTPPPFVVTELGRFDQPFAMAFLPDATLLVTEKGGTLKRRLLDGTVRDVPGVPTVATGGQGGLLDIAPAPDFLASRQVYLTYSMGPSGSRSELALARARLNGINVIACRRAPCPQPAPESASLSDVKLLWRSGSPGVGGQFGAKIAFAPDGRSLFLSSGERQRFTPAQDLAQPLGKILHLTLDGAPMPDNPFPRGIWTLGHRNPYGLLFTPDGLLWEEEMGPRGGDELNVIVRGRNYGWPIVSNGDNYSGQPIPDHPSRPDLEAPKLWWNPSISPGGMIYYTGAMFPQYRGSLLIGALSGQALIRVTLDGDTATAADQWAMGTRIRDVAQAPDGAIWLLEDGGDGAGGRLLRLTPKAG